MQSSSNYKNIIINGLALNVPNSANQAQNPSPAHNDLHVELNEKQVELQWDGATGAVMHYVYWGNDSSAVYHADTTVNDNASNLGSAIFLGKQSHTSYLVTGLQYQDYYWRIDEQDERGVITKGNVWKFAPARLAFRGAQGYGRFARGGRGGVVVKVTNLNDSGPGSLRQAVENDIGARTIVFDVAGVITLQSRLSLNSNNVTIAGQTAPGKGIVIRGAPFGFSGVNDGIMRFMRIRLGAGQTFDGTGLQGSDHCIFDHNSVSWTIDEAFSSRSGKNITLQKTILSEALNAANHQNYPAGSQHGYAASISGDKGSFHHNLLAHNSGRNWSLAGGLDANGYYSGRLDIFNNVVYNWKDRTTDGGAHEVNFVNNYYKPGPATKQQYALSAQWDGFAGTQRYYCSGNIVQGIFDNALALRNGCKSDATNPDPWVQQPFFESYATIHSAEHAFKVVLSDAGANMPMSDSHDLRMIEETRKGTTSTTGSVTGLPGLIDHQNDAGGYESYPEQIRPATWDEDGDGMPNWFEEYIGTNPKGSGYAEANAEYDESGYTNLEEYLHWMATPHIFLDRNQPGQIDLTVLSSGFTNAPTYDVSAGSCVQATVQGGQLTLLASTLCGLEYVTFTVKDAQGHSLSREIGVFVNNSVAQSPQTEIIKHGAGPSSQSLYVGQSLEAFYFNWYNAQSVTIQGLPAGITATIDDALQKISLQGSVTDAPGDYVYTITTVGGLQLVSRQGTITVLEQNVGAQVGVGVTGGEKEPSGLLHKNKRLFSILGELL
jgi:hypothetical protein